MKQILFLINRIRTKTSRPCYFSTSSKTKAIPPILWFFIKPISKLSALLLGRGFRQWWRALPSEKRALFYAHIKRNRIRYSLFGLFSGGGYTYYYNSHLQYTPITNRQRFMLFSNEHLKEIELLEREAVLERFHDQIVDLNSPYTHRALRVANRLFQSNKDIPEVGSINWTLTVIKGDLVNAVAFPNGEVLVFTGLLDFSLNDDEIATVIAHEMSHAILQHAAEHVSRNRIVDIFSIGLILIIWSLLPSDLTSIVTQTIVNTLLKYMFEIPYSRELEKEADKVGIILAAKACFDVRYAPIFWKRMDEAADIKIPELLSTHPTNENRAKELEKLVPEALILRERCNCDPLSTKVEYQPKPKSSK